LITGTPNHWDLLVRGYTEEGTTTTAFDVAMLNDSSLSPRVRRRPIAFRRSAAGRVRQAAVREKHTEQSRYIERQVADMPAIRGGR